MERKGYSHHQQEEILPQLVVYPEPFEEIGNSTFEQGSMSDSRTHLTYTLSYDLEAYQKLQVLKDTNLARYRREKEAVDGLTTCNLVTMLGERLNASVSDRIDSMDNRGIMRDRFEQKPLIEWYEKGQQRSKELGSSVQDQLREAAEIEGQRKIQSHLSEVGKMMISVSPPGKEGSVYKHNFYDVFHRISETDIEVVRYMSGLTVAETMKRLGGLGIDTPSHLVDDIDLLAHPFEVEIAQAARLTSDDIHDFLHSDIADSLSREEMAMVKNECMPLINRYLLVVAEASNESGMVQRSYNAILNKADDVVRMLKKGSYYMLEQSDKTDEIASVADMFVLGSMAVREVDTGCGFSGGFSFGNSAPFSVLDFSLGSRPDEKDQYESLYFNCPGCHKENKRPYGVLIPNCQKCGIDVSCGGDGKKSKKESEKRSLDEKIKEQKHNEERAQEKRRKKKKKNNDDEGFLFTLFQQSKKKKEQKEAN